MGLLHGIVARIMVGDEKDAGTDDDVYLGLFGKGGGCEFPLDTRRDDFLTGRLTKMHFGVVWEGEQLNGSLIAHGQSDVPYEHHLNGQTPSGHNSPGARQVDIDLIEYVTFGSGPQKNRIMMTPSVLQIPRYFFIERNQYYRFLKKTKPSDWDRSTENKCGCVKSCR